ncbi:MAG: fumarylacetoacetate hydrolase family protein [Verrucomicrobia bacterium]|nr:fumarylacetoacetate hydrolase family protein [Verrucomicrobiota bacterium]
MNIWCAAKNYLAHANEMREKIPEEPVFFLKAGSCLVEDGKPISLPLFSHQIEYEVEIALRFSPKLKVSEAGIAIDLTARDIQAKAKKEGLPWLLSKSFPGSCPAGGFFHIKSLEELSDLSFELKVNGERRQEGFVKEMIFSPKILIENLLNHFPVEPGDLLLTGTPAGISRALMGDRIEASIRGRPPLFWTVG